MKALRASLVALGVAALAGCAGALNFDAPPDRTIIGGAAPASSSKPESVSAPAKPQRPAPQPHPESYRVAKGDTLFSIAFRNSLDYREIAQWNGIGSDYKISVGQVLRLSPPAAGAPEPQPAPPTRVVIAQPAIPVPKPLPPTAAPAPATTPAAPVVSTAPGEAPLPSHYQWQWPTAGKVMHGYAPAQGVKGIDFTGNLGQPVFAAAPGRVVYSGNALKGYGELIIIKHDDTHLSAYGYNRRRYVEEGDVVTQGQPIGELGMGPESKPLLHFEIRERGTPVNPMPFLPARPPSG